MPSAKVIPLAARAPTPWKAATPAHNPRQAQAQVQQPDRQSDSNPKLVVVVVDVAWNPLPKFRFRPLLWHAHAERTADRRTDGQADRHAKLCGVLMWIRYSWPFPTTPTHFPAPLVTTRTPFLGWALCLSLWYVWLAMWILHGSREREREGAGRQEQREKGAGILQNSIFG